MAMALAMDGTCPQFDCDPLLGVGSDPLLMVLLVIPYWVMFGTAHDPSNPEPGEQVEGGELLGILEISSFVDDRKIHRKPLHLTVHGEKHGFSGFLSIFLKSILR
jgi:hypothetical protein